MSLEYRVACDGTGCANVFEQQGVKAKELRDNAAHHGWRDGRLPFAPWFYDLCPTCGQRDFAVLYEQWKAAVLDNARQSSLAGDAVPNETLLADLGLPTRSYMPLIRAGLHTVGQVRAEGWVGVMCSHGFSRGYMRMLEAAIGPIPDSPSDETG